MRDARGGVPERPKGTGCKPVGSAYGGSNPPAPTLRAKNAVVDERALKELQGLEQLDGELAGRAEKLRFADAEVAAVRARAEAIDTFFAGYPAADDRLVGAADAAEREVAQRRQDVAAARAELERAREGEPRVAAERALARAQNHLSVTETRVAYVAEERRALEHEAATLPEVLPELAERATSVSGVVPDVARPEAAPLELIEWASHAHAVLFAAAAQVAAERERVIREANELASMLLGEPTFGATPAQARARVEAALR
jgi:hypothetical protein